MRTPVIALWLIGFASPVNALYEPAREYTEAPAVAVRYPDPAVEIRTPAFAGGKSDFTSQDELVAFIDGLARRTPSLRVRTIGTSQQGRAIPLLIFARPSTGAGDLQKSGRPTVLIIGQQHGNEPAGGEAALALAAELADPEGAKRLDHVNVLIVPRANPDGAYQFVRGLANGADVNRDHLLGGTPEGRALGHVFADYEPDVVLDCHEFGVRIRWLEKFGGLQRHDALIQYATVSNLPPELTDAAETMFRRPLVQALSGAGLTQSWYYTSSYDRNDRVVSMGGVVPDTGRNIAGLRNAISFLIETRGVGIGRAHLKRRVYTHLVAMRSMLDSTAANAETVLALVRRLRSEVAATAGKGEIVIAGTATTGRSTLDLVDPETGADKTVDVEWRSALAIEARRKRTRPFAYLLPGSETETARRLVHLGATVTRLREAGMVDGERYRVTRAEEAKKDDVRRNDEEAVAEVIRIEATVEPTRVVAKAGDFYVPLDQPLANVIAAALEPDTQSSYAANRVLSLPHPASGEAVYLPLYRVSEPLGLSTTVWEAD